MFASSSHLLFGCHAGRLQAETPLSSLSRFAEPPLAGSEAIDLAILDINLGGQKSFPIADLLTQFGIPVIFATGYGLAGLEERFAQFPVLAKPFSASSLSKAIESAASNPVVKGASQSRTT